MLHAAEIKVMLSAAFKEAYLELVPRFEGTSGYKVTSLWVPSVQMMRRLKGGEVVDMMIMSSAAVDELVGCGVVAPADRFDLATCGVGVAVRAGAPKPDISSAEAFRMAVMAARSIVYSTGPSGVYLAGLFERMGIGEPIKAKLKQVQGEPAGTVVARGEAEIGFQQICELLPVPGIDLVGPLPSEIQEITTFTAGIHVRARQAEAARTLARLFKSNEAAPVIRAKGMDPISG